ncbi:MAG: hypothetical protein IJ639_09465, partial [Ruminococcus sp.]|nr:hypothetical protein [Ruminococcus sp.]
MKKVISLVLVMAMLTAMLTVSFTALSLSDEGMISAKEALAAYKADTGEEVETQRIYLQMPNGKRGKAATQEVSVHREVVDPETSEIVDEYDEVILHVGDKAPSWYSEYSMVDGKYYPGAYWWEGAANAKAYGSDWCGFRMEIDDYDQGIYYVDIPIEVTMMNMNNGVDGGMDSSKPIYYEASQTLDFNTEGVDPCDTLPYGSPGYDDYLS